MFDYFVLYMYNVYDTFRPSPTSTRGVIWPVEMHSVFEIGTIVHGEQ